MPNFTEEERKKRHEEQKKLRKKLEGLSGYMSRRLEINKWNRDVRKLQKEHEALGLPWPPPKPTTPEPENNTRAETQKHRSKNGRAKSAETSKQRPKDRRARSAEKERTHFEHAPYDWMGQTWRAHDRVAEWRKDALSQVSKAEIAASAAAVAAINARSELARLYNDKGEAALTTAIEAATRAEAALRAKSAYADRFSSEQRMRSKLERQLKASKEEGNAKQQRRDDAINVRRWGGQIFSNATNRMSEAWSLNSKPLAQKWSYIATEARKLENSVEHTSNAETKAIANYLGDALTEVEKENTTVDNLEKIELIKGLIDQAKKIKQASDQGRKLVSGVFASIKTKGGSKTTKKHTKKHKKKNSKNTHYRRKW